LPFVTNPVRRSKLFPTSDEAETAFYDAFERGDLAAMMAVWAESDAVVCVHPRGPRLVGFDAVRDSWTQIFAGGNTQLRIKSTELRKFDGQSVAVHTLVEVLTAPGQQATQSVCSTNVYELTDAGWRMVVHHATPLADPVAVPAEEEPASGRHTLH
jgi:ketosteroid isomerase-like protein